MLAAVPGPVVGAVCAPVQPWRGSRGREGTIRRRHGRPTFGHRRMEAHESSDSTRPSLARHISLRGCSLHDRRGAPPPRPPPARPPGPPPPPAATWADFKFAVDGEPTYFSLAYTDLPTSWIVGLLYNGMYRINDSLSVVPDLATGMPETSAARRDRTGKLRGG